MKVISKTNKQTSTNLEKTTLKMENPSSSRLKQNNFANNFLVDNGGFETGTFTNWQTIGDTSIETSNFGVIPSSGAFQALLTNGASDSGGSVIDSDLEQFLGLSSGALDNLANADVTEGSAIKQTFSAQAGDVLTFDWNFLTNETTPDNFFNDFAFFSITPFTTQLADTTYPLFAETFAGDFNEETGYQNVSIAISQPGTYTLSFGVVDVGDNIVDSALLIDNIQVGPDGSDQIEPNDTIFQAIPTGLIAEGSYNISTEIGDNPNLIPFNDVDLFELTLDAGNQLIADIDASQIGSQLDPILSIFNSQGDLVAQNDDSTSLDSFINFTADSSDTYYVGVSSYDNSNYDPFIEGSGTGNSSGSYDLFLTINDSTEDLGFDIEVNFIDDSLTSTQQAVFENAASRWEQIITADIPDLVVPGFGFVDDVVIDASAPFIDGPGGILGQAGPTVLRSDSFLPARGIMQFDLDDLSSLEQTGSLEDVILHEMAHVLGFGTIWQELDLLTGIGSPDPSFLGQQATNEYNNIFTLNESTVPVEAEFGPGTALSHWDEEVFVNELMTGFLNIGENPLSRITAASMTDLGYEVNVDAADIYTPPTMANLQQADTLGRLVTIDFEKTFVDPILGYDRTLDLPTEIV
ncbi:MAG: pre-peptidase C-terminal domain-containing protein [Mastigocoleus sp. MO_167.B18]|nr:pre-peptidase C-terminal domain-containing protein [Mastigocoleus sp. MO_167.B18]